MFLEQSPRGEVSLPLGDGFLALLASSLVPAVGHLLPAPFSQVILPEGLRPVGVHGQSWGDVPCVPGVRACGLGLAEKTLRKCISLFVMYKSS